MLTRAVAPNLGDIGPAVGWADGQLAEAGVPPELRADIQVCMEEALANLVLHGRADAPKDIRLGVAGCAETATVVIKDRCRPFDPLQGDWPPPATLENAVIGGNGLRLMRGLATSLRYETDTEGNTLTMTFATQAAQA